MAEYSYSISLRVTHPTMDLDAVTDALGRSPVHVLFAVMRREKSPSSPQARRFRLSGPAVGSEAGWRRRRSIRLRCAGWLPHERVSSRVASY